jgi:hypothetical protein
MISLVTLHVQKQADGSWIASIAEYPPALAASLSALVPQTGPTRAVVNTLAAAVRAATTDADPPVRIDAHDVAPAG